MSAAHPPRSGVSSSRIGATEPDVLHLALVGGFELRRKNVPVRVPQIGQRVAAFVAMHDVPLRRGYVAGVLWPDASEQRSRANLRSALWQLRTPYPALLQGTRTHVWLNPAVRVDWKDLVAFYTRILQDPTHVEPGSATEEILAAEFLPDWYEDWVIVERERFRQLRAHALETLSTYFTKASVFWLALEFGLAAAAADPLRESAHRAIILAHLAEGNRSDALHQFDLYRELVRAELGIEPSNSIFELVGGRNLAPSGLAGRPIQEESER
jgi:DNA-binding SARP family transcriptional activator